MADRTNSVGGAYSAVEADVSAGAGTSYATGVAVYGPSGSVATIQSGAQIIAAGGTSTVAISAGTAGNTTVKASPGYLCRVLVTTLGTNAMQFKDGASGTIIGQLAASAAVGTVYDFQMPAAVSIVAIGNAANGAVTVGFI